MTDPLSITLAAITLATALKDMVELAQAIEESFQKVSRNRRKLRSLVSEIKTTVSQLKKFSDDHYDILCDAVDTKLAVLGLISDMRTIYDKCRDMSPPVPPNRIGRLKLDVKAWLNNNKINEDIKNLRNRVDKCHSQFLIFAVMRIENHLIVMKRQTDERPKQVQEDISFPQPFNDNLVAFMGSNARTLSKLPPEITVDAISDTYLRIQINTIDYMLNQLSSNFYPVEEPLERYLLPYRPIVPQIYSLDKNSLRQAIVLQSLEIQSYLRGDSHKMSILAGAWYMVNLCIGLQTLKMYQEGLTIIKWAVNIFRTLVKGNSNVYLPYLAHSLRLLSRVSMKVGNIDESFSAIEEAIQISRALQSSTPNIEIGFQLGEILTTLAFTWALKDNKEEYLKAATEAVDIYRKTIIKHHDRTSCDMPVNLFNSPLASFFEGVPHHAIRDYGWALNQLSFSFEANHLLDHAYKTAREALEVTTFSSNIFNDNTLEIEIASILCRISHRRFHDFMSLEEALSLSERAVAMFRYLSVKDVEQHGISLCKALWQEAKILGKLKRWDEALVHWRETAKLANDIMNGQLFRAEALDQLSSNLRKLKRHDEAALIRTESLTVYSRKAKTNKVAHGYFDLGVELRLADRRPEAIKAHQVALTQYRVLAFKDPEYEKNIGRTLNELTVNYVHCNEWEQAFNEGHESLKLHKTLIEKDSSILTEYIFAIKLNSQVAELADNEEKCVERARYNVVCAHHLTTLHPTEANLLFGQMVQRLAIVLTRFGRLSEAGTVIQESLERHEKHPFSIEGNDVEHYMQCLITISAILFDQGYIEKAAGYLQKSIDVGKPHSSHKSVSSALANSMHRRVQFFYITGLYAEAVEASQEGVDFAHRTNTGGLADLIGCLQVAAITFKYHGKFKDAIDYIQEALHLSRSSEILESSKSRPSVLVLEIESLTRFCEILADTGQEAEALVKGKAAVDSALGLKFKHAILPWSSVEPTYFRALETYSIRLAANEDLSDSLDRLIQIRSYYENRIKSRLGESLCLACVLEAEGMISCAAGRLDDGAAALAKLHDLQNRLRIVHPELAKNVEVALERQRASPSVIALVRKLDLKCNHNH